MKSAASTTASLTAWKAVLPAYCVAPTGECTQGAFAIWGIANRSLHAIGGQPLLHARGRLLISALLGCLYR